MAALVAVLLVVVVIPVTLAMLRGNKNVTVINDALYELVILLILVIYSRTKYKFSLQ